MVVIAWRAALLTATTLYQLLGCALEDRSGAVGQLVNLQGRQFHVVVKEERPVLTL